MANMGLAISTYGQPTVESHKYYTTCSDRKSQQDSQPSSGQRDPASYTPPPEDISAGRRSQNSPAGAALDSAFASEEEQPMLFPPSFYRTPTRSRSRPKTSPSRSSTWPTSAERTPSHKHDDNGRSTFDGFDSRDRSYSPMSAGFASLSRREGRKHVSPDANWRGRPSSPRGTLELEAMMFKGPS